MSLKDAIREAADERNKQQEALKVEDGPEQEAPVETTILASTAPTKSLSIQKPVATKQPQKRNQSASPRNKTVNTANSKAIKRESSAYDEEGEAVETAALTIRVPRSHRIHWLIGAKREGSSLTAAITEALNARYGEPTD